MAITTPATPDTVRLILETDLTDPQLQAFIDAAAVIITSSGMDDADCHTDASITQVHIWLSAHLAYARAGAISSEKIGDAAETKRNPGVLLTGIESTYYGQSALNLDCSGILATTGKEAVTFQPFGGAGS